VTCCSFFDSDKVDRKMKVVFDVSTRKMLARDDFKCFFGYILALWSILRARRIHNKDFDVLLQLDGFEFPLKPKRIVKT
jgi:hypothetical protein